jgi:hypothetical protein
MQVAHYPDWPGSQSLIIMKVRVLPISRIFITPVNLQAIRDPAFLKLLDDGHETFMIHDRLEVFMTEVFSVI